jgi:hypothetical protein
MSAAKLIDRLHCVRRTGPGRWIARCPGHPDGSPSLSVRQLDDGRWLIHDFGGCGTDDVLAALGLQMSDLFPERLPGHNYAATHSRIPPCDLLEIISEETSVVAVVAADMLEGRTISELDWRRLAQAAARSAAARDYLSGG